MRARQVLIIAMLLLGLSVIYIVVWETMAIGHLTVALWGLNPQPGEGSGVTMVEVVDNVGAAKVRLEFDLRLNLCVQLVTIALLLWLLLANRRKRTGPPEKHPCAEGRT